MNICCQKNHEQARHMTTAGKATQKAIYDVAVFRTVNPSMNFVAAG